MGTIPFSDINLMAMIIRNRKIYDSVNISLNNKFRKTRPCLRIYKKISQPIGEYSAQERSAKSQV